MIKEIKLADIPEGKRKRPQAYADIEKFMKNKYEAAEIEYDKKLTVSSVIAKYGKYIRQLEVPIKVCKRDTRIFLLRKETS